jgi:hypothetical protein
MMLFISLTAISKVYNYISGSKKMQGVKTCSTSSLVGHSTTARGRLGLVALPDSTSSRLNACTPFNADEKGHTLSVLLPASPQIWFQIHCLCYFQ